MSTCTIRVVLFDLGGVLFQLAGVRAFGEMIGEDDKHEVLRLWVTNPWVQRYDRGACFECRVRGWNGRAPSD